jgi:ribosomal protein S18 acetylase RimI-like enzyme
MQIEYSEQLPNQFRASAVRLYLDAFQEKLIPILGNDSRAQDVLEKNLDITQCLAAICDQKLVGILAIQNNKGSFLNPTLRTMIKVYGIRGGFFRMCALALMHHSTAPDELYVDGIAVVAEMRGNGIGSRLLHMVESIALKKAIRTISLEVLDTNPRAEALYRRIGFIVTKQRKIWPLNYFIKFPFKSTNVMVKKIG